MRCCSNSSHGVAPGSPALDSMRGLTLEAALAAAEGLLAQPAVPA